MARKRKKGRKPKNKQPARQQQQQEEEEEQPRHMKDVVNSAMFIDMLEKATAADQIVQLQQRVGCLQSEREQLRQRVAESKDQREAVFDSLKQTVVDAKTEIQVLVAKTRENDERRRREHEDTQRMLEERLSEVQSHRVQMACMQADIRQKNKALDELDVELRMAAVRDEELVEGRARLSKAEKTLDTLRRKLVVVGRAGAGEEIRGAIADRQARKAEERASLGIDSSSSSSSSGTVWARQEIPGLGLTPLLMEGMSQFPEDVKLTRDTLALLGHVASMEAPGRSFLAARKYYINVVAALQRHVTDGVVALHAARLLHKAAFQGESSAGSLRDVGVIPLLAEVLAAAAYGLKGARRPRRLLYHAFGAIRLCYPKGFFDDSLQALRIQESAENSTNFPAELSTNFPAEFSKASDNAANKGHPRAAVVASAAGAATATAAAGAANAALGPVGQTNQRTIKGGAGGSGIVSRFEVEKERWMREGMPWADLGSHDSSKRQTAEDALARARARPLPRVRGPRSGVGPGSLRRGSRRSSALKRSGPTRQLHAASARDEKDIAVGNGYWDLVGGGAGVRGRAVEQREEVATATASVVLLRWAMEDRGAGGDVGVSGEVVESEGEMEREPSSADDAGGNKATNRSNKMNAAISGSSNPHAHANKPKDWPLSPDPFKESPLKKDPFKGNPFKEDPFKEDPFKEDPLKEDPFKEGPFKENPLKEDPFKKDPFKKDPFKERRQSDSTTTTTTPAEASKVPPGLSRSMTWARPKDHPSRVLKSVRSEWQPRWPEHARRAFEGIPPPALEGGEGSTGPSEAEGDQTAARGESSKNLKVVPNRWRAPAAHCVVLHALVCLLRAVEVDNTCGNKDARTSGTIRTVSDCSKGLGARGVVTESSVLLLILKACDTFNAHAQVVTTCCMLMRIGVRYSAQAEVEEQSKQQPSSSTLSRTELLVRNSVDRVVRRAAKSHQDNATVAAEVSALLKTLGMDPLRVKPLTSTTTTATVGLVPSATALSATALSATALSATALSATALSATALSATGRGLRRANTTTRRAMAGILVDVEVVAKTETLDLNNERRSLVEHIDHANDVVSAPKKKSESDVSGQIVVRLPRLESDTAVIETAVLNPE